MRNDSLNVLPAEPLSSTAPQLSEDARFIRVIQKRAGRTLALTCPGQGHPPPTKRSVGEHVPVELHRSGDALSNKRQSPLKPRCLPEDRMES